MVQGHRPSEICRPQRDGAGHGGFRHRSTAANSLSSLSEYFQPLMEFLAALDPDEKVVLVGHSIAGLGVSMAMENFPAMISVAVFVAASTPGPDFNLSAMAEKEGNASLGTDIRYFYDDGADKPPTAQVYGPLTLKSTLYSLSPHEDVTLATALVRPQRLWSIEEMNKEVKLTSQKYGSVRRVFMVTDKDLVSSMEHQQWMIQRNPPDGVIEITGSDHMAMASKPSDLAHQLQLIANNYTQLDVFVSKNFISIENFRNGNRSEWEICCFFDVV